MEFELGGPPTRTKPRELQGAALEKAEQNCRDKTLHAGSQTRRTSPPASSCGVGEGDSASRRPSALRPVRRSNRYPC